MAAAAAAEVVAVLVAVVGAEVLGAGLEPGELVAEEVGLRLCLKTRLLMRPLLLLSQHFARLKLSGRQKVGFWSRCVVDVGVARFMLLLLSTRCRLPGLIWNLVRGLNPGIVRFKPVHMSDELSTCTRNFQLDIRVTL